MRQLIKTAKISLGFVWIFTGLTSILFEPEFGYKILSNVGVSGIIADLAVIGGSALDILLGIWILTPKWTNICCIIQIGVIAIYTILLTIVDYSYWFHPFGPLIKNFPIIVLILMLYNASKSKESI